MNSSGVATAHYLTAILSSDALVTDKHDEILAEYDRLDEQGKRLLVEEIVRQTLTSTAIVRTVARLSQDASA